MRMNKEQQELLDEAFNQFSKYKMENFDDTRWDVIIEMNTSDNTKPCFVTGRPLTKEEFINKCKTDTEFSQRWGLKIEERELDMFERWKIADLTPNMMEIDYCNKLCDEHNVPTKLITITYNDKTIEMFLP